jgi:glycosyltransferase involved in cell wall biosynthesis
LRAGTLAATIRRLKPDLIHTLETQHSGYLALSARETLKGRFPPWLHTPWGSDLYLFGRLSEHEPRVRRVLSLVDAYQPKSKRDADLALKYGFTGRMMPIIPGNGGFDMVALKTVACRLPPSKRTVIHMKGYQGWAGRALFALRALRNIKKDVAGLRIRVTSAAPETALAVELLRREEGMNIEVVSAVSHEDILGLHAESRVSLGASISDGVPNSALEAMAMGAFPIESVGSCAGEWVEHGRTGLLIDPEDVAGISEAVLRVLEDDALVDSAAEQNRLVIEQRMNDRVISSLARETYREVLGLK